MATPVLATKLFIPPQRAQAVSRARLIDRLHEGREAGRKLTLISAPAGFGKTTLLSEWIADSHRREPRARVAWLSLDEGDNDPSRFLTYLLAALQRADAGVGPDPLAPEANPPRSMELTLTDLINQVAQESYHVILVLDDFQSIEAASVRDALTFLLDHLPSNLHVVIASRTDPLLPLSRLRGGGELTELRATDLRFTPDEAATFLNRVMGLGLRAEDIAALEARTEGWIAGLQLAALSMRERSDIAGFIEAFTGSNRFIIDYLGEEVLQRQPDYVRSFLLQTAFLDRLSGPLCEAVTGRVDSSELLETLERDNLFVVPLDDRRQWYRYHHLFADVLRARSLREDRERAMSLHRLASEWHDRNDLPEDAVKHALAAGDVERAASLIERALPDMRRRRQDATLLGWLKVLPDEAAGRMPVLSVYYAWASLISGDLDAVERRLADAERALATTNHGSAAGEELRMLPVSIAVYRASVAQARGDVAGTEEQARHAVELTLPGDHLGRATATGLLALALWAQGDLAAAVHTFAETRAGLQLAGHTADLLASTVVMSDMLVAQGRPLEALRAYEQALELAEAQGDSVARSTADLHVGVSELLLERGDLGAATEHLRTAGSPRERGSFAENSYRWFVAMARVRQAEGDLEGALDLLGQAERDYVRGMLPEVRPIGGMKARIWIEQGRFTDALAWINEQGLAAADDLSYLREYGHITLARLLIAQYRVDRRPGSIHDATALLERLLDAAEAAGRTGSANEILAVQSIALEVQGQRPTAQTNPGLLSERELTVLRLLVTELSGPQIARELFVSLNTLRTHTRHIFDKLAVNSRPAAVRRAQEQGLL